jgi:hypothetical protein
MAVGVAPEDMAKAARFFAKETATAVAARL